MNVRLAAIALLLVALFVLDCRRAGPPDPSTPTEPAIARPTDTPPAPLALTSAPDHLDTPTYDGTGQAVHPDIVHFPQEWHGFPYWMAITPYPHETDTRENPSVLVSHDGLAWTVPPGVSNPLAPAPPCDHNSDPDIVHNPRTDELFIYYTEVLRASRCGPDMNENHVRLLRSSDGVRWSAPETVMTFDLETTPLYVSPAVVYRNGLFHMWMPSNADSVVHATSADGVSWSPPREVELSPAPWHIDVAYVEEAGEYWMLLVDALRPGSELYFASSADGLRWEVCDVPLLSPGPGWDRERIYRSTFLYDEAAGALRVWYSARNEEAEWRVGYSEASLEGRNSPC